MEEIRERLLEAGLGGSRSRCEALFSLYLKHGPLDNVDGSLVRITTWRMLLGVPLDFDEEGESVAINRGVASALAPRCARVVKKDAERTRGEFPCFSSPEGVERTTRLLTYYTSCGHSCQSAAELQHNPVSPVDYPPPFRHPHIIQVLGEWERSGFLWEHYDDKSGRGLRSHPFTGWTSLILNVMAEQYSI